MALDSRPVFTSDVTSSSIPHCDATAERPAAAEVDVDSDSWRDDDSSAFKTAHSDCGGTFTAMGAATRRFAMDCICRIISQCETADSAHFNMALAQERRLHQSTGRLPAEGLHLLEQTNIWTF